MSRNLAASIRARLKQHADEAKQDFNLTLTHYCLERLLYRLFISPSTRTTSCSRAPCCFRSGMTTAPADARCRLAGLWPR